MSSGNSFQEVGFRFISCFMSHSTARVLLLWVVYRWRKPVHTSWSRPRSRFYTVNHRALASNYQLSNMKRQGRDSNGRPQRLKASTLIATPQSPPPLFPESWRIKCKAVAKVQWQCGNTLTSHLWDRRFKPWTLCGRVGSCLPMVGSLQYRTLTHQLYPLVFRPHTTTSRDMTCTVLQATWNPK